MTKYDYDNINPENYTDQGSHYRNDKGNHDRPRRDDKQPLRADSKPRSRKHSKDTPSSIERIYKGITSRTTRIITALILTGLTSWLCVSALSYLKTSKADQSVITATEITQPVDKAAEITNIGGPVGAEVSHHLFLEGLGFGSVVLIVYMAIIALALFGAKKISFWKLTFKSLILAITISMVLGLVTVNSSAVLPPGGYHGHYINQMLIANIGWIGAALVSIVLVGVVFTIYLTDLINVYNRYKVKMRTLRDRRVMENDRIRDRRNRVEEAMSDTPLDDKTISEDKTQSVNTSDYNTKQDDILVETDDEIHISLEDEISDEHKQVDSVDNNSISRSTVNAGVSDKTANDDPLSPEFEIGHEKDIEQGNGLPENLIAQGPYDPKADLSAYRMPPITIMLDRPRKINSVDLTEQEENKERITQTLGQYNIKIDKIKATVGPTVTLYEIVPAEGVRIAQIKRLEDDIAMSLSALGIRIIAPIPGRGTIGIEVPNKDPQTVSIRSILGSKAFQDTKYELPMAMGATISNDVYIADLAKMPHLLVAGATGQGKSVGLNTIIASLLYKKHPAELKFVLVDPKMVEFSLYACLEKHYLAKLPDEEEPVVTDPNKVVDTLNSLCKEMDDRYALLKEAGARSIIEYNSKFISRRLNPEHGHRYMPYIVMIVDEFADLIMMAGKAVETPIARIAQKARAVGMHMIIATQRPSTNVITGLIKANFPGRIGFRVSQMVDSRTILDAPGANQLIGRGDMLISHNGAMERVQCAFIDTDEVEALCAHIRNQIGYPTAYILPEPPIEASDDASSSGNYNPAERDTLLEDVGRWIVQGNTASTSSVQRRYSIGYNRAGKIMDQLEHLGVVDRAQGGKPRRVLVDPQTFEEIISH